MATKKEMADYTVFFSVLGHKKSIHKILAKSESVHFQPLFKLFWCSQRITLKMKFDLLNTSSILVISRLKLKSDGHFAKYYCCFSHFEVEM